MSVEKNCFFSDDLLEKVTILETEFFSTGIGKKLIIFFPSIFIFSLIIFFLFHFQCLDPPVLPVNENVPPSGKLQGSVWGKPPRDVWPRAWWERTLIHSEQTFLCGSR